MGLIINRMILNKLVMEHEMLINVVQAFNKQNPNEQLPEPSQAEFLLLNYHITKMTAEDGMWSNRYELEFETDSDMVTFKLTKL